jgi:hypothetical protein
LNAFAEQLVSGDLAEGCGLSLKGDAGGGVYFVH